MKLSKNQGALGLSNKQNEIFIDIKNQVYMGKYSYHGEVEKNKISYNIPSIVSRYTWNKANLIHK